MKATIVISLIGVLGFNEQGQLVEKIFFDKDPKYIAKRLDCFETGKTFDEIVSVLRKLETKGFDVFVFENASIAENVNKELSLRTAVIQKSVQGEDLRQNLEKFATKTGFTGNLRRLRDLIREVSLELTRIRVKKEGEKKDLMVAQAILSIDDLDRTINLFMGRIREWYGLHFPELDRLIEKHETYARLVMKLGEKINFTVESLEKEALSAKKAKQLEGAVDTSIGAELAASDMDQIRTLCKQTIELYDLRQNLQNYADSAVEELAPNVQALVGSMLAARLIALAGGLKNLAKMPASTIQILGAEKALFRSLKTGTRPPKHGIIFQDSIIHDAKKWQRGKMSRALAGKLAIAARTDAFSGRYIGDSLKANLERRAEEIRDKYRKPPTPPQKETKQQKRKFKYAHRKKRRKKRGSKR